MIKIMTYEVSADEKDSMQMLAEKLGIELRMESGTLTKDSAAAAAGCDAVTILGRSKVDSEIMEKLSELGIKFLSTRTVGFDHIDISAAEKAGIRISHASYPPDAVADFTIMLMLMVLRNCKPAVWRQQVNDYSLEGLKGRNMRSRTVGIIGTGAIGTAVAKALSGFGCRILAFNITQREDLAGIVEFTDLEILLKESDIITLHLPCTPKTERMINRETLGKMKDGVILVNTARGELMDIPSIIEGIENQKIGGLAMDVFAHERGIYHSDLKTDIIKNRDMAYLRQFPNVVFTQHMAFYTQESVDGMVESGIRGLLDMINGRNTFLEIRNS